MPSTLNAAPEGLSDTGSSAFNRLWTLVHLPVVNVPGLMDGDGVPLGLQVIGGPGKDAELLAAASFLETPFTGR